ncbi:Heme oxygenase 2 [Podila clonocystis]|nr:Heme oxygenase 2 [Podila clonocystis]
MIAHAYVRYLGEVSGGQILAKKLQTYRKLPEGQVVAFHQFGRIEDRVKFKELFRERLTQVEMDEHLQQQIVKE